MKSFLLRLGALLVACATFGLAPAAAQSSMVRVHTNVGPIDMTLVNDAPLTTANFLAYVRGGDYTDVFFHRSAWVTAAPPTPFVIQAGYYKWLPNNTIGTVTLRPPVNNEFSVNRSNLRGTVAMAKVADAPNSATSQWFINMMSNTGLDTQNGGFTVFARLTPPSLAIADYISLLPRIDFGTQSPFRDLPVVGWTQGTPVVRENVIRITSVTEIPTPASDTDRILNYLEAAFPQYIAPWNTSTGQALGYNYRYYSATNSYVGTKDGSVWFLVPALGGGIRLLGSMETWLASAAAAGY